MRGLKALGVPIESYRGLLSSILLNKLPSEIHLILSRRLSGDDWDSIELFGLREIAATSQSKRSVPGRAPPTTLTLVAPATLSCAYCGQSHTSVSCPTIQTGGGKEGVIEEVREVLYLPQTKSH